MASSLSRFLKQSDHRCFLDWIKRRMPYGDPVEIEEPLTPQKLNEWLDQLDQPARQSLLTDMDRVDAFAGEDEQLALRTRCIGRVELVKLLDTANDDRSRAMAILERAPNVFEAAERDIEVGSLLTATRSWAGYKVDAGLQLNGFGECVVPLEAALSAVLHARHGGQRRVRVAVDERPRASAPALIQISIWHEGDRGKQLEFDEAGEVTSRISRKAVQSAIQFDPSLGTIEVAVSGGAAVQAGFAEAFAAWFWPDKPDLKPLSKAAWALQKLRSPQPFRVDRASGVRSAALQALNLRSSGPEGFKLRLESVRLGSSIWSPMATQFRERSPLLDAAVEVTGASIRFVFEPTGSVKRPPSRTAKLSAKGGFSCPKATDRQRQLIDNHLRSWGLSSDTDGRRAEAA